MNIEHIFSSIAGRLNTAVFIITFFIFFSVMVLGRECINVLCKLIDWSFLWFYFSPIFSVDDDDVTTSGVTLDDVDKRVIFLNRPQPQKFSTNHISTAKYRLVCDCGVHVMR